MGLGDPESNPEVMETVRVPEARLLCPKFCGLIRRLAADRTSAMGFRELKSERSVANGPLPQPVKAREHDKRHEQEVEEFRRNLNHCRGPRPHESRTRGMQSS
jgi:hypothetical protein